MVITKLFGLLPRIMLTRTYFRQATHYCILTARHTTEQQINVLSAHSGTHTRMRTFPGVTSASPTDIEQICIGKILIPLLQSQGQYVIALYTLKHDLNE